MTPHEDFPRRKEIIKNKRKRGDKKEEKAR